MIEDEHRVTTANATLLFTTIYLQKFAITVGGSTQISLCLVGLLAWTGVTLIAGLSRFDAWRFAAYLGFLAAAGISQTLAPQVSFLSVGQLLLTYLCFTVRVNVDEAGFLACMRQFQRFMLLPACIGLVQYMLHLVTSGNILSLEHVVPSSFLLSNYSGDDEFGFRSGFVRPTGLFFLESSFFSIFLACAVLIELRYFKRRWWIATFLAALLASVGGSGFVLLAVGAPFLLRRGIAWTIIGAAIIMLGLLIWVIPPLPLPFISRLNELQVSGSSGFDRLVRPFGFLVEQLTSNEHIITGFGAGSITGAAGSAWPLVKLIEEYGQLSALGFLLLYLAAFRGTPNRVLTLTISVIYLFTGGYLLSPVMPPLIVLLITWLRLPVVEQGRPIAATSEQALARRQASVPAIALPKG